MPDWLRTTFTNDAEPTLAELSVRLLAALALGCVIAGVYRWTQGTRVGGAGDGGRRNGQMLSLIATLVLLTILIAMMTMVIGNNVARAFSVVGALAIVRFRTVVEDTRDTAFVIFAVSVGMAIGAGYLKAPLVAIPIAAVAAYLFRPRGEAWGAAGAEATLTIRVGSAFGDESILRPAFDRHLNWARMTGASTARQGAALERIYSVHLRGAGGIAALVAELNEVEGVQSVELRCL